MRNHATGTSMTIRTTTPPEDPLFPASNLRVPDRYLVWGVPATGGDVTLGIDVGPGRTTHVVGIHGFVNDASAVFPNTWSCDGGNVWPRDGTWAAVVPPRWLLSTVGTLPQGSKRDDGLVLGAPVTYRYFEWRFAFNSLSGFSLGNLLAGQIDDLGIAYSPGSTEETIRARVTHRNAIGAPRVSEPGRPRSRRTLQFNAVPEAMLTKLRQMAAAAPVSIVDPFSVVAQYDVREDGISINHRHGPPDLYDVTLALESLP